MNSKLNLFIKLFIFNYFQVYIAASRTFKYNIYVFSMSFKNSYGCIGMFGDTLIVDDYN